MPGPGALNGHPALVWRGGTPGSCEVKDHPEDAGPREGGGQQQKPYVCVCKTKGQPSPPPRPIETHRGPERQVSKSPARLHQRRSLLCVPHKGREWVILGARGCVVTLGTPPAEEERGPRRAGCPLSLARTRPGQTMPRVGWGRLLSPSFIHSLFKVGRRERS